MHPEETRPIYAIAGPTASGKTALGVELAKRVSGEVVNFDSVQIYREIEIATAKPSAEEKQGIPHHLLDYVDPRTNYTAADWERDASAKIAEIEERGGTPVLVGGTGFYLRTLLNPLFESPKTDVELRDRLRRLHTERGAQYLHRMLAKLDPPAAARLASRDYVRVIRALEVLIQTGERISVRQTERPPRSELADRLTLFVLDPPRDELYRLIDARTERHFARGLVEEVKRLRASGIPDASNALGSHGYRRVCEYLRSERPLDAALGRTKQDIRNYSKRQITWFRTEPEARWLKGFGSDSHVVEEVLKVCSKMT